MSASFFARLRERKLVQWAVAYVAGAWLALEIASKAGESFNWPASLDRVLLIAFAIGFVATLVLAWYHGEKGRQRFSGAELLILAALLAVGGGVVALFGGDPIVAPDTEAKVPELVDRQRGNRPGLTVAPFETLSSEPDDRYFSDGLNSDLVTRLQSIAGLRVIDSRGAEETYDVTADARVSYVLEGDIQPAGGQVSANFRLVDSRTREQLWAQKFRTSASPDSLVHVQSEVVRGLAAAIGVEVRQEERRRLNERTTSDARAYDLYLRAIASGPTRRGRSTAALTRVIELLTDAVEQDSNFVEALRLLTDGHAQMYQGGDRTEARAALARASLDRLREIAPESDYRYLAESSYYYFVEQDYELAYEALRDVRNELAWGARVLTLQGFIERRRGNIESSVQYLLQADSLAPVGSYYAEVGASLWLLGRYDEMEEFFRIRLENFPEDRGAQSYFASFLASQGRIEEARRVVPPPRGALDRFIGLFARDWVSISEALNDADAPENRLTQWQAVPSSLWRAWIADATGDSEAATLNFDAAVTELQGLLVDAPDDHRLHVSLGLAFAGLGRADPALEHAAHAIELMSPEKDAMVGPVNVFGRALIHARLGDGAAAAEVLEEYWSGPHFWASVTVELDPRFDRVREDPAFKAVMERQAAAEAAAEGAAP